MIRINKNEATAARRRVYFHLVDATDGLTAETGEAAGQPQISVDGSSWTNTGIGTLVAIGNGRYYAELTQAVVNVDDTVIETRYKSANTAECPGDTAIVDIKIDRIDATITSRSSHSAANVAALVLTTPANKLQTNINGYVFLDSAEIDEIVSRNWDYNTINLNAVNSIGKLIDDNLDVVLSTRLATTGYTVPPTTTQIRTAILDKSSTAYSSTGKSVGSVINVMRKHIKGKLAVNSTKLLQYDDDGAATAWQQTLSDNGVTVTRGLATT